MTPEARYNHDPGRCRSIPLLLSAYWERHPELSLTKLLLQLAGTTLPSDMSDADWSDVITRALSREMSAELGLDTLGQP